MDMGLCPGDGEQDRSLSKTGDGEGQMVKPDTRCPWGRKEPDMAE